MFVKATKEQSRLRLGLVAISGGGKTFSALRIASILATLKQRNGRVAVIDSEKGSAAKYADQFDFDTHNLDFFSPQKYIEAIDAAKEYDVIIIDSISHLWEGEGGELEMVDNAAKRSKSGNTYFAWRDVTPFHRKFIDKILTSPAHVICTMRAKTEYVVETNSSGKTTPRKIGTKPIQREGMEYEFDVVGDLDGEHNFIVSKTRCPALDGKVFNCPGEELGKLLIQWLTTGTPATQSSPPKAAAPKDRHGSALPLIHEQKAKVPNLPTIATEPTRAAAPILTPSQVETAAKGSPSNTPADTAARPDESTTAKSDSVTSETPETSAGELHAAVTVTTKKELLDVIKELQNKPHEVSAESIRKCYPTGCKTFSEVPQEKYDSVIESLLEVAATMELGPTPLLQKQYDKISSTAMQMQAALDA